MAGYGHFPWGHGAWGFGTITPPTPPGPAPTAVTIAEYSRPDLGMDYLLDAQRDLVVGTGGNDFSVTPDGITCLLQDAANGIDTLPGDLFGYPQYGSGVSRLLGEHSSPEFIDLVRRAIEDFLQVGDGVSPRIEPLSVNVKLIPSTTRGEVKFETKMTAIDSEENNSLNLVWGYYIP